MVQLHALGLCGIDNSVNPGQLVMYAHLYPRVEFGVLFRPDKEGQPRYPTKDWVRRLSEAIRVKNGCDRDGDRDGDRECECDGGSSKKMKMKLAAHLCERRVDEVLRGDDSFVGELSAMGFGRVQINATAVNGVDTSVFATDPSGVVDNFLSVVAKHPELEFILQKNAETQPLWQGVLDRPKTADNNISLLLDESKGTGILPKEWPPIPAGSSGGTYKIGYAGGMGPSNVSEVLSKIKPVVEAAAPDQTGFWIDMESGVRSTKNGRDVFDLDKCYEVIVAVCDMGFMPHPPFLAGAAKQTGGTE